MKVFAVGNGSSSRIWRERSGEGPAARESGASPRGMAAAAVAFLAALLLLPGEARANTCDALSGSPLTANCDGIGTGATVTTSDGVSTGTYSPISYTHSTANVAGTVYVGSQTGSQAKIVLTAMGSGAVFMNASGGDATLEVGGVSEVTVTGGGVSSGVYIWRGSGDGTSTITIEGDVTIGASGSPIATNNNTAGVRILQETAGAATITSAATIYANRLGIWFSRNGANSGTTADSRVENTGNINVTGGHGIYAWYARSSDTADTGDLTVTSSGDITTTAATGRGISVDYRGHGDLTVGHTGGTITSNHQGVFVSHGEAGANNQAGSGDTTINIGGDITAATRSVVQLYQIEGTGDITVMMTGGDLVATADNSDGIFIERAPNSGNEAANSGAMSVTTTGGSITGRYGIEVRDNTMYTGAVTISNGADITARSHGLYVSRRGNGATSITNTGGTVVSEGWNGIFVENRGAGATASTDHVTVTVRGGTVRANAKADPVAAALATTPSAAAANRAKGAAVLAMNRGTGNVIVEVSGDDTMLISKYNAGIFARLWEGTQVDDTTTNNGSQIKVTQGGTIQGRKGVYAFVAPHSTAETVVARADPAEAEVIDVTWTGAFSHGTDADVVAENDNNRFVAATVASAFNLDREVQAGQVEGSIRYGAPAGIEAQVMTWRDVVEQVAKADRDGATIADRAAQLLLFNPTAADGTDLKNQTDALVKQAKAAIDNGDVMVEDGSALATALGVIDTDNNDVYTETEIETYLGADGSANRAALVDLMTRGLSDKEKAVLAAVATGDDAAVDDALTAAGVTDDMANDADYWSLVKAFLNRYNVGNIKVTMDGGSIDSRGDGIRAYYATPNANNGAINVTVGVAPGGTLADGTTSEDGTEATITGAMAGIYVANAGVGDLAMNSTWGELLNLDADVTGLRQQFVMVNNGTVMGGTDAAVHLAGGGALLVGATGKVHAGSSGVGVLMDGLAHVHIHGEVQGAEGGAAAVHMQDGSVRVSETGRVLANGAAAAIRADDPDGDEDKEPAKVTLVLGTTPELEPQGDEDPLVSTENIQSLLDRVDGIVPTNTMVAIGETGEARSGLIDDEGNLVADLRDYSCPPGQERVEGGEGECAVPPPCPEGEVRGEDGMCAAPPPPACPEGEVRGEDGMCAAPPPPACPEGEVRGEDGMCAAPPPPACPEGEVRGEDGMCAAPPPACPEGEVRGEDGMCAAPPPACPEGEVRGEDGMCAAPPPPACPEGEVRGEDGMCAAPPPPACPEGEVRGEDGMCAAPPPCTEADGSSGICRHKADTADINVTAEGSINGSKFGIHASYETLSNDNGEIVVTIPRDVVVTGGEAGIYVENAGVGPLKPEWTRLLNLGELDDADVTGLRQHYVTVHGTVRGGTDAAVHLVGGGMLHVGPTGKVLAGASGNGVRVNDPGVAHVLIQGEVQGAEGGVAAVDLPGGGSLRVSETGKVLANGATDAIRVTDPAGPTPQAEVILPDDAQALSENVEGSIVVVREDGSREPARPKLADGDTGGIREAPAGLLDPEGNLPGNLEELEERLEVEESMREFDCKLAIRDDRCRPYAALPSVLLSMNGLPTYEERMSAVQDGRGGWARVEVAGGKWQADSSTRQMAGDARTPVENIAYDHRRQGLRAGLDFEVGDAGRFGVSVHGLRGSAEMALGGEVDLEATGLGVHATRMLADTLHVDAQAAVTRYDVDVESADAEFGKLAEGVNGSGFALGMEVGRRMALRDGVSVTPRAGFTWSTVDLDDFTEDGNGAAARVSVKDARSLKGRVGVGVEKTQGDDMQGSRVFGSLDLEQEFSDETETRVSGMSAGSRVTSLKAKAERSAFRLAVGGARVWGEGRYSLQGSVGYTASGSDNRDLGGGLSFSMQF